MPCSIAACSTVLPFSTVSCRPSIVRFTVSITQRLYRDLPFEFDQGGRVLVDVDRPERAFERNGLFDDLLGERDQDVLRGPVRVSDGDGQRQVVDLSLLVELELELAVGDGRGVADDGDAAAVDPAIEKALERLAAGFFHRHA